MQGRATNAEQVPGAPATQATPGASALAPAQPIHAPATKEEVQGLLNQREEISRQLTSARSRRSSVANSLDEAAPAAQAGLQQHLNVLDGRIIALEQDLEVVGKQLRMASPTFSSQTSPAFPLNLSTDQVTGISIVFIITVMMPIAIGLARIMFRRATRMQRGTVISESAPRIERIEQAVDAIAIEVERVSEGQRFMTKLLSEAHAAPVLASRQEDPDLVRAARR